jgi:hypothetical protein
MNDVYLTEATNNNKTCFLGLSESTITNILISRKLLAVFILGDLGEIV